MLLVLSEEYGGKHISLRIEIFVILLLSFEGKLLELHVIKKLLLAHLAIVQDFLLFSFFLVFSILLYFPSSLLLYQPLHLLQLSLLLDRIPKLNVSVIFLLLNLSPQQLLLSFFSLLLSISCIKELLNEILLLNLLFLLGFLLNLKLSMELISHSNLVILSLLLFFLLLSFELFNVAHDNLVPIVVLTSLDTT